MRCLELDILAVIKCLFHSSDQFSDVRKPFLKDGPLVSLQFGVTTVVPGTPGLAVTQTRGPSVPQRVTRPGSAFHVPERELSSPRPPSLSNHQDTDTSGSSLRPNLRWRFKTFKHRPSVGVCVSVCVFGYIRCSRLVLQRENWAVFQRGT